jgi:predicted Zn-dependent protease
VKLPALLVGALALGSAGTLNATPAMTPLQPGQRPPPGSTEAELWYGMDEAEKDLRTSPSLVKDPALNDYVRGVACSVAKDYCRDLRVYVVDVPVFNASMAPNGVVLVFTGALLRIHDEAELALVLGHEFAHYQQRHALQYWLKARHTSAFLATFSLATYGGGIGLVGGLAQLAGAASMFQFSRQFETQADRIGFRIATGLGYDPQAGVRIWSRLLREEKASSLRKPSPIFASHPKTEERLADVRAAADAVPAGDFHDGHARYLAATRPLLQHWLAEELSRRTYDTSIRMIEDLRDAAAPDALGTFDFYLAEAYRHRGKSDDRAYASELYAEAVTQADAPADAWREFGLDLRNTGKTSEAAAALHHYLQLAPNADDRAFIEKYLAGLESQP